MDQRDEQTWIAIELSKQGEIKIDEGTLESSLRSDLGVDENYPIFVPAATYSKSGKTVTLHLVEGYVFVASGLPETRYFQLENKPYVTQVMSTHSRSHGMRVLSVIPDAQIRHMRHHLRHQISSQLTPNTVALVTHGIYENLEGVVVDVADEYAVLEIKLRALHAFASIPFAFLEPVGPISDGLASEVPPTPHDTQDTQDQDTPPQIEAPIQPDLTARYFHEPLISVLGSMTQHRTGVYVSMDDVQTEVLRHIGYDPENLPDGLDLDGQKGLRRRIGWAFRNQRKGYCKTPLTVLGTQRGEWGLTEDGVLEARRINHLR